MQEVMKLDSAVPARQEPTLMDVISAVAANPGVDVGKIEALLNMRAKEQEREAKVAFSIAMCACQKQAEPVLKNKKGNNNSYADLEAIDCKLRPIYTAHGFSLSFNSPDFTPDGVTVSCRVFHSSGHSEDYHLSGGLDGSGAKGSSNKTPIQALGSTVKYLRRYLTCMIFNVMTTDKDNDGNRPGSDAPITQDQADNIHAVFSELGMDAKSVGGFLNALWAESVENIPARDYKRAMNLLDAKRRQLAVK